MDVKVFVVQRWRKNDFDDFPGNSITFRASRTFRAKLVQLLDCLRVVVYFRSYEATIFSSGERIWPGCRRRVRFAWRLVVVSRQVCDRFAGPADARRAVGPLRIDLAARAGLAESSVDAVGRSAFVDHYAHHPWSRFLSRGHSDRRRQATDGLGPAEPAGAARCFVLAALLRTTAQSAALRKNVLGNV